MTAINHLRRFGLLRDLSAAELRRVHAISKTREFAPGTRIFTKSETAEHMFVVMAGRVKIYSGSDGKKRKTFAYLGPGDFFGEMAVLDDAVRSASAEAVASSRLLIVHKNDFRRLLLNDSRLTFNLLKTVSARLRRADEEIENLLFRNVLGRVSKALFDLGRKDGRPFRSGILLRSIYTHQELADLVGTTREPLSRALAMLRRADLVETTPERQILLRDPKKLEAIIRCGALGN